MPRKPAIPLEIQVEVQKLVEDFNHKHLPAHLDRRDG